MSYELSFSEEFFTGTESHQEPSDTPTNVLQAIGSLSKSKLQEIAREVLGKDEETSKIASRSANLEWEILDKVRETNTCRNINSPVEVYIDRDGGYSVKVYDRQTATV